MDTTDLMAEVLENVGDAVYTADPAVTSFMETQKAYCKSRRLLFQSVVSR
jgi:hypothetical protein